MFVLLALLSALVQVSAATTPPRPLATPAEIAEFLGVPKKTVYSWRSTGGGPPALRVGKHLRYRWEDVEAWLAEQR
jgi:excisionase family DNA binding protein